LIIIEAESLSQQASTQNLLVLRGVDPAGAGRSCPSGSDNEGVK